jgi:hypothetical protein
MNKDIVNSFLIENEIKWIRKAIDEGKDINGFLNHNFRRL